MQRLLDYFFSVPLSPLDELNAKDEHGNTRLIMAASVGDLALMTDLLDQGADLEVRGQNGFTALAVAASVGQIGAVDLLITRGADIETETDGEELPLSYGMTPGTRPLGWAAVYGHEAVVRRLLQAHAKVNKRNGDMNTPLILAAAHGHAGVVKLLLEAGAKKSKVGQYQCTAEKAAEGMGHQAVLDLLRASIDSLEDDDLGLQAMELDSGIDVTFDEAEEVPAAPAPMVDEDEDWPNRFLDPVSLEVMDSPVATKNGHTYDRQTLVDLFNHNQGAETVPCPVTRKPIELEALTYVSNIALKEEIAERRLIIKARQEAQRAALSHAAMESPAKRMRFFVDNNANLSPAKGLRSEDSSLRAPNSLRSLV